MTNNFKSKILNLLLIITTLFGYLEWSSNSHTFLFTAEKDILIKIFTNPHSVLHPFTILPMASQIILCITLFQKNPSRILTYISIAGLGLLLGLMFVIGLISVNLKILISTIPFIIVAFITVKHARTVKKEK